MPTAIKLHRAHHADPLCIYEIVLWVVSAIMLSLIVSLLANVFLR